MTKLEAALNKLNADADAARKAKQYRRYETLSGAAGKLAEYLNYEQNGVDMSDARFPTVAAWLEAQLSEDNEPSDVQREIYSAALEMVR